MRLCVYSVMKFILLKDLNFEVYKYRKFRMMKRKLSCPGFDLRCKMRNLLTISTMKSLDALFTFVVVV